MGLRDRIRRYRQTREEVKQQLRAERNAEAPLREFAYLDDVSVYSLFSSRFGPIPESHKDSLGRTTQTDLTAEAQVGFGGSSGKAGTKRSRTNSQQSEVTSKSNVQAAFRKLLEFERSRLSMQPARGDAPRFAQPEDRTRLEGPEFRPPSWFLPAQRLERGSLIEIEVEVRATKLFSLNSMFSLYSELAGNAPELFGAGLDSRVGAVRQAIEQLLAGLIPLKCTAPDYVVVTVGGEDLIIHKKLYEQTPLDVRPIAYPLVVVGLTEEKLYWRDVRRVIFSGARFLMLARVSRTALSPGWEELKVVELISEVNPAMAELLREGMQGAVRSATEPASSPTSQSQSQSHVDAVSAFVGAYTTRLVDELEIPADERDIAVADAPDFSIASIGTAQGRSKVFDAVDQVVTESTGRSVDPERSAKIRDEVAAELEVATPTKEVDSLPIQSGSNQDGAAYLEVEVVALYW